MLWLTPPGKRAIGQCNPPVSPLIRVDREGPAPMVIDGQCRYVTLPGQILVGLIRLRLLLHNTASGCPARPSSDDTHKQHVLMFSWLIFEIESHTFYIFSPFYQLEKFIILRLSWAVRSKDRHFWKFSANIHCLNIIIIARFFFIRHWHEKVVLLLVQNSEQARVEIYWFFFVFFKIKQCVFG